MESQFVNCSKCGTRNFSDDKRCGVCNASLPKVLIQEAKTHKHSEFQNWHVLFIIGFIVALLYFVNSSSSSETDSSQNFAVSYSGSLNSTENKSFPSSDLLYTVKDVSLNTKRHFNADVTISKRVSEAELIEAARRIRNDIKAKSSKGIVGFYLPEMKIGNGAWATVTFDPNPVVRLYGLSQEAFEKITLNPEKDCDCIGIWIDNTKGDEVAFRIRRDEKLGFVYEYVSPTNPQRNDIVTQLIKGKLNGKTIYRDTEHPEQYFVINKAGDLMIYDNFGYFDTFKKIR